MRDFIEFVRTQGVVGLAVGFILGGAVSGLVSALVKDVISPLVSILLGRFENLSEFTVNAGSAVILLGDLITVFIDFVVIVAVVYFGVKLLKLDKLDQKKES